MTLDKILVFLYRDYMTGSPSWIATALSFTLLLLSGCGENKEARIEKLQEEITSLQADILVIESARRRYGANYSAEDRADNNALDEKARPLIAIQSVINNCVCQATVHSLLSDSLGSVQAANCSSTTSTTPSSVGK